MVLRNTGCGGVLRVFGYVHSEKETRGRLPARTQPLDAGLTNQAQAGAGSGAQWKKHALPLNYPDRSSSALGSQGLPFQRTSTGYLCVYALRRLQPVRSRHRREELDKIQVEATDHSYL